MSAIVWEEPPPAPPQRYISTDWAQLGPELIARPGEWGRVREYAPGDGARTSARSRAANYAAMIREGLLSWTNPKGTFEAVARPLGEDRWAVYVRYVGDQQAEDGAE